MEVEEDAPLEDWTVKELKDECKTLGLSDKGKKAELIERIRTAKAVPEEEATAEEASVEKASVEEVAVEEAAAEESAVEEAASVEEASVKEAAIEESSAVEEAAVEEAAVEEPIAVEQSEKVEEEAPLEDWTVKELKNECKTLGLSDKGRKAELIERIRKAKAVPEEEAAVEETAIEETVVEE